MQPLLGELRPGGADQCHNLVGGAHRDGGFHHHQITFLQHRQHAARCCFHIAQIRLVAIFERGGHAEDEGVGRFRLGLRRKALLLQYFLQQFGDARFIDVHPALIQTCHHIATHIHAHHRVARLGQHAGGGQSHITKANNADLHGMG